MEFKEIQEHLRLHQLWLQNDPNGKRANLYGANLYGANLYRANLSGVYLSGANLFGANLSRADLSGAYLSGANLFGANLSRADLSRANLFGANLSRADLSRANLSGANLFGANLSGAYLSRANLKETLLAGKVILSFQFERHAAHFYGSDEIVIGCEKHSVAHWVENYVSIGQKYNYSDVQIQKYGRFIKGCANILKMEG